MMRYSILEAIDRRTGLGVFSSVYDNIGDKGRAACDARLMYLRDQDRSKWTEPQAKKLSWRTDNDCKDIYEIRFMANKVQQRPMGYFGPKNSEFTVVVWATHKGINYKPRNFCRIAKQCWEGIKGREIDTAEVEID